MGLTMESNGDQWNGGRSNERQAGSGWDNVGITALLPNVHPYPVPAANRTYNRPLDGL